MPQIAKGGKHVFGWSEVGENGKIKIPSEAIYEYNLNQDDKCLLIPGSKTSGGFGLSSKRLLKDSILIKFMRQNSDFASFKVPEGKIIKIDQKNYCWVRFHKDGCIYLSQEALNFYGLKKGVLVLSVRGSYLAVSFLIKGPIYNEAKKHQEIIKFS